jgi:DNA-binding Lrp family transcriptional regulator
MTLANIEQTKRLREHLLEEISKGRKYFRARYIARAMGISVKAVGTRLGAMERDGVKGIRVTKYSDKIWRVEICHECRKIRGDPRAV